MMTAYGEGFLVTPLELTALVSAIANGGTLYYLQYPRSAEEVDHFIPKVKRTLDLDPQDFSDIKAGMRGAVDFGDARRVCRRRAGPRQDGYLHRFQLVQPYGLVRIFQRCREPSSGGGSNARPAAPAG